MSAAVESNGSLPNDGNLFESAPCGLVLCHINGTILRANATFCRCLGYTQAELTGGKRVQDLLTIGGRLFYQTHCNPLLTIQGSVAEVQMEMVSLKGERVPVLVNIIRRQEGMTQYDEYAVMAMHDRRSYERELLRERKNAEQSLEALRDAEGQLRIANEQLSQAHERKDEFLATLAHELRNPLAPMRNVLEVVRLRPETDCIWAFNMLERQTKQLTHLVDDLMDVSRINQGRLQLRLAHCDLIAITRAAVDDIRPLASAANHTLEVDLPAPPLMINADETRLTQIVVNLLTNAIKYTPEGGRITLSIQHDDDMVRIAIRDNGIGIPVEALQSVFDMFSQLAPALERSQGGLGIGLALVHGLVELHSGRISAHSDGPGCGSTFTVTLPLLVPTEPSLVATIDTAQVGEHSILVVDDNADAADTLAMALELLGNHVYTAYSAVAALQSATEQHPDVMLLDIGLPDMDGYELARRVRAQPWGKKIIMIAVTGWGQDSDRARAHDAGFDHHMVKPIQFERLRELLSQR
ncbi:ATP-binding protein [Undibacterium sp. Di27W]|uniref:hybrid sensor histidine kinase/response regulator n=1 Tax=Undibacterium sp. Di27W TaxID=3413036 RepID=UPI003BF07B2D